VGRSNAPSNSLPENSAASAAWWFDQPALAACFDMQLGASRSPSFAKFRRDLVSMFRKPT